MGQGLAVVPACLLPAMLALLSCFVRACTPSVCSCMLVWVTARPTHPQRSHAVTLRARRPCPGLACVQDPLVPARYPPDLQYLAAQQSPNTDSVSNWSGTHEVTPKSVAAMPCGHSTHYQACISENGGFHGQRLPCMHAFLFSRPSTHASLPLHRCHEPPETRGERAGMQAKPSRHAVDGHPAPERHSNEPPAHGD